MCFQGCVKLLSNKVRFSYLLNRTLSRYAAAFILSEALWPMKQMHEAVEKFAAAPRECACLQDGGRRR